MAANKAKELQRYESQLNITMQANDSQANQIMKDQGHVDFIKLRTS